MSNACRVYLNACGMINALGDEGSAILEKVRTASTSPIQQQSGWLFEGEVPVAAVSTGLPELSGDLSLYNCRNNAMLAAAYAHIQPAVEEAVARFGNPRIGIVLGTSTSGISDGEPALRTLLATGAFPDTYHFIQQEIGSVSTFLAALSGAQGPAYTISTACSSSAKAFLSARNMLRLNWVDAVLVGGVDTLCQLTLSGFHALAAVSPSPTNPMSRNRSGITIGEGAALFLMTREPGDVEFLGGGESSDAHHISAPEPEGRGAEASMRAALRDAGLEPKDVDYINMHGTGTPLNDQMESRAIDRVFGCGVPCSSTKALHGHTLGAAGAIEAGICWNLIRDRQGPFKLPVHHWDGERDPELPPIRLVGAGDSPGSSDPLICLSNSFAFGGNNCSVILGHRGGRV